jgi:tripartite ATP-independent transporter DctM subunit
MSQALIGDALAILLFIVATFGVLCGFPIAFSLAGFSLIFAGLGWMLGVFDPIILTSLPSRYFGLMTNEVLVAVPLFIFMGAVLERSKIAEALLETMGQLFGTMRGGLAISVVLVGALLAASTGVVGATVVTMGLLSLPAMMRAGYDPKLATGVICASGTLGQIIPPSVILIFIGDLLMGANQLAAQKMGKPVDPVSVGDLFAGAFLPGLALVALYIVYILIVAAVSPASAPALKMNEAERASLGRRFARALVPPLLLIVAVLGSILAGFATPTEAASIGALGSMALAAFNRAFSWKVLLGVMRNTAVISALVFGIVLGVSVFSLVFRGLGGEHLVEQFLVDVPGGTFGAVMAVMVVMFVLGFFMDTIEIILIVVPITAPVIIAMGVEPVWLGVMIGINLQTAFLTPPVGFALFYMRAVAPRTG